MSEFFKALEQAERDRVLGQPPRPPADEPAPPPPAPAVEAPAVTTAVPEERVAPPAFRPVVPDERVAPSAFRPPIAKRRPRPEVRPLDSEAPTGVDGHMVSLLAPTTFEAEQYRTLRHMIEQLHASAGVSIIACTSPTSGDGKTTTAINVAGALAQAPDAKILLIDADLRRPCVARELTLGDDTGPGLVGAIVNRDLRLEDVVRRRPPFTLSILPAGSPVANPYELLKSPRLGEWMEEARRRYDYVVVDTPPIVNIPDCRAIARVVDGFIVVVAAHRTARRLVEEALNSLEPAKVIGLLFNADDRPVTGYYYGHNGSAGQRRDGRWTRSLRGAGRSIGDRFGRLRTSRPSGR
jgi:capsular exopolysaccharide synthesis family protein